MTERLLFRRWGARRSATQRQLGNGASSRLCSAVVTRNKSEASPNFLCVAPSTMYLRHESKLQIQTQLKLPRTRWLLRPLLRFASIRFRSGAVKIGRASFYYIVHDHTNYETMSAPFPPSRLTLRIAALDARTQPPQWKVPARRHRQTAQVLRSKQKSTTDTTADAFFRLA